MKDFENEFTCTACQCTYIQRDGGPKNRCRAHENLPDKIEEEVKYKYRDISNQELADRIQILEDKVADLMVLVSKEKTTFAKTCEKCGKEFQASAPRTATCPACKGNK